MSYGWECPKCGRVWARWVDQCRYCNKRAVAFPMPPRWPRVNADAVDRSVSGRTLVDISIASRRDPSQPARWQSPREDK